MNNLQPYHQNDLEIYMEYQAKRDAPPPVPYTPPQSEVQPYTPVTVDLVAVARPIISLSIVGGIVCVVASGFAAACAATFAFVSANAAWFIGGALVVGWASGLFKSAPKQDAPNQAPPNDGGKYEWYQEQRQGWRKM
jgi:hypothetical protein